VNILIPMAGAGKRFKEVGYSLPKPLIDVAGQPMIQRVVESLNIEGQYIFIVQKEHIDKYHIDQTLKQIVPDCRLVVVDGVTEGQACTALLASRHIDNDEELMIVNCDNYFLWETETFTSTISNPEIDGMIFTFNDKSGNKSWSYAEVDESGQVVQVAEKEVISTTALAGAFYWRHGADFIEYTNSMISKDIRVNNEFYISPVFNEAVAAGKKIFDYNILEMRSMDTPESLAEFESWLEIKKMSSKVDTFIAKSATKENEMIKSRKMQNALEELRQGKPIILVDEYDRENEGDIVISAERASVENLVFTMNKAKGLMCVPMTSADLKRLDIPPMVENNTDANETPFTVSVDGAPKHGTTTGMSVYDRLTTLQVLLDPTSKPDDLTRPGHLFPLRARDGLLKERRGHTEGSVELMKLAGLKPAAIICEIMNDDGTMTKGGDLNKFAVDHGLSILSIEEVYEAAYNESL
jgi:3,4-dihydroxy-2-butanone 4-phosphate synthase